MAQQGGSVTDLARHAQAARELPLAKGIGSLRPFYLNAGFVLLSFGLMLCMDYIAVTFGIRFPYRIHLVLVAVLLLVTLVLTARRLPRPWWRDLLTIMFIGLKDWVVLGILMVTLGMGFHMAICGRF